MGKEGSGGDAKGGFGLALGRVEWVFGAGGGREWSDAALVQNTPKWSLRLLLRLLKTPSSPMASRVSGMLSHVNGACSDGFLGSRGKPWVEVGEIFDECLVQKLASQEGVDAFGEHGEFHTVVSFEEADTIEGPVLRNS